MHSIFYFGKILGFNFSAFQRNVQPSPQVLISGVWGHVTNKHQAGITGTKFLPGRHLLRKDALLASSFENLYLEFVHSYTIAIIRLTDYNKNTIISRRLVMFEYMTVQEAAKKWELSERRVQKLCAENRIDGVIHLSRIWLILQNAEKPADKRKK